MRVDTADGEHRFVVSLAGYGYMGDLMQASEKLRWMGPPRYTTAGAVTLFRGQTYHARIAYRPVDSSRWAQLVLQSNKGAPSGACCTPHF